MVQVCLFRLCGVCSVRCADATCVARSPRASLVGGPSAPTSASPALQRPPTARLHALLPSTGVLVACAALTRHAARRRLPGHDRLHLAGGGGAQPAGAGAAGARALQLTHTKPGSGWLAGGGCGLAWRLRVPPGGEAQAAQGSACQGTLWATCAASKYSPAVGGRAQGMLLRCVLASACRAPPAHAAWL